MELIIFACFIISFLTTFLITPHWIKKAKKIGLTGKDIHKLDGRMVAELGGIIIILGFLIGLFTYIALDTFYLNYALTEALIKNLSIMASISTILLATIIGIIDDILGWKIGLRQWQKPVLMLFAALPIMVVNSGSSIFKLPLIGPIELNLIYPLIIIPLAIVGAANGFNMIAGYNGLETGMGIIIISTLSYISWISGKSTWVAIIGLCMVFALFAFYFYNKFPAKVFPGDTMTYAVGTTIAIMAIIGDLEKAALLLFIPYFIELILKLRGKLQKQSYAKILPNGSLVNQYNKFYGLEHLMIYCLQKIKKKVYEIDVVAGLFFIEIILAIITILIFS